MEVEVLSNQLDQTWFNIVGQPLLCYVSWYRGKVGTDQLHSKTNRGGRLLIPMKSHSFPGIKIRRLTKILVASLGASSSTRPSSQNLGDGETGTFTTEFMTSRTLCQYVAIAGQDQYIYVKSLTGCEHRKQDGEIHSVELLWSKICSVNNFKLD